MPGYRLRMPAEVHPISAGIKGGIVGGLVMPVPALAWGVLSGHGLWYPVNLLAGMGLPGIERLSVAELEQFRPTLLVVAIAIHAVTAMVYGLAYGVLLPTLPQIPRPIAWGGLLMPVLWTGATYGLMRVVNPVLNKGVDWPWFIASQFLFGIVAALVIMRVGGSAPILGRAAGRRRRRHPDADARPPLGNRERPGRLVPAQPAGGHGDLPSGRGVGRGA